MTREVGIIPVTVESHKYVEGQMAPCASGSAHHWGNVACDDAVLRLGRKGFRLGLKLEPRQVP